MGAALMRSEIALVVDLAADIASDNLPHAAFSLALQRVRQTEEPGMRILLRYFGVGCSSLKQFRQLPR